MYVDENVVAIMVVEGISNAMVLMVVIIQIPRNDSPYGITRSGIIPR